MPGTERKAQVVSQLFGRSTLLTGSETRRSRLLDPDASGRLGKFTLLHFATHGYVDDERSALVLSTREGIQKASLADADIGRLNLRSNIMVLSACDTGLGRQQSGEGVMGLPYAFTLAGNINTLMALCPVDDDGTAAFTPIFLKKLQGRLDSVVALNETKR